MKCVLKFPSGTRCPNCGELNRCYLTRKGNRRGIMKNEYEHSGVFDPHYGEAYKCFTCGYSWQKRTSKKTILVRLLPFLENK